MTENASRSRGTRLLVQQCVVCVMMMVDCVVMSEDCRQQMVVHASLACINSTVTCVELLGPRDVRARSSIPVIIASPHGGTQQSDGYASRDCRKNGWVCQGDGHVNSVAAEMITSFSSAFGGRCPWVVYNHLHRSKLDPNRDIEEGAGGDANAEIAWRQYHTLVALAQRKVATAHGLDTHGGVKGLLVALHGYSGMDFLSGGSPYTLYGFRISDVMLNQTQLPDSMGGSVAHAAERLGEGGLERIVRGDVSLGQLVPPVDASLIVGDVPAGCGIGLPSPTIPNPLGLCSSCNYFSGSIGRDLALHDSVSVRVGHKQSSVSMRMNVVQVELPRCVRGASSWYKGVSETDVTAIRRDFSMKLAVGLCTWLHRVFGEPLCGHTSE